MNIEPIPGSHKDFAICKISPRRWIVLSVYLQWFDEKTKALGAVPVYGPDLFPGLQTIC